MIEATPENFELKSNVLKRIDPLIRPDTIVASATSSLSITKLASALSHPDRFVGMQFFHPVPVMALVEIVRGLQTSDATRDAVETLSMKLGKAPVTVRNGSCSVISRILSLMVNEAFFVLAEGNADPSEIDEGMKLGCNHPIGPLALADLIGLDVLLSVMQSIHDELGDFEIPPGASPQGDGRRGISRAEIRPGRLPVLKLRPDRPEGNPLAKGKGMLMPDLSFAREPLPRAISSLPRRGIGAYNQSIHLKRP